MRKFLKQFFYQFSGDFISPQTLLPTVKVKIYYINRRKKKKQRIKSKVPNTRGHRSREKPTNKLVTIDILSNLEWEDPPISKEPCTNKKNREIWFWTFAKNLWGTTHLAAKFGFIPPFQYLTRRSNEIFNLRSAAMPFKTIYITPSWLNEQSRFPGGS